VTIPDIKARLIERFIFNFRVPPDELKKHLPAWLEPHEVSGFAVGSFCILDLDQITIASLPNSIGLANINCALRFGIIERDTGGPAVFVFERNTNSAVGSFVTSLGFPGEHKLVKASVEHLADNWSILVHQSGSDTFAAKGCASPESQSKLFKSTSEFDAFIAAGARSYCPAKVPEKLNIVDLRRSDATFEPHAVSELNSKVFRQFGFGGVDTAFDSCYRTQGGNYIWSFIGQR
jgi:hypothetical protein